jgi:hypothetical protein
MTDVAFIVGAYLVVLGAIAAYVVTLGRRLASALELAESIRREGDPRDEAELATSEQLVVSGPSEAGK